MSKTYNICEVTVTIPTLGTITTDGAGNQIKRGDKCRVHLYAIKPDWHSGTIFEGFNVGAITFTGYTESPFKRSQKIMMPDGYKLVALRVEDDGMPTSWDSLAVQFVGGLISLKDADGAVRARTGNIHSAEPFSISMDGQVFVTDAKIGNGVLSTDYSVKLNINNDGKGLAAGMTVSVEYVQGKVMLEADRFAVVQTAESVIRNAIENVRQSRAFEQVLEASQTQQVGALAAVVKDGIRRQCQPGGLLWRAAH